MNIGGPALHVSILSSRLDPERFETLLVSGREGTSEGSMEQLGRTASGLAPRRLSSMRREIAPLADLRALAELTAIARRFRPDIVHTHLAKAGLVGRLAARMAGAPVVVHTFHGSVFREYFGPVVSSLYAGVERALARITTRLVALTPRQREMLIELRLASPDRIVVIPLGLDLELFERDVPLGAARAQLGIAAGGPLVGIVARLVPVKDVATFLRAAALLPSEVRVLVVGDGESRNGLVALASELALERRAHFTGWRADLDNVYAACDIVVLSSLNEGSPVSLVEAMAAGRAVVATAVGGVPDVVEHGRTGLLVPPRDPRALADAIERLLRDPSERARLGAAARRAVRDRFAAERLVRDIALLYEELLERARGRA